MKAFTCSQCGAVVQWETEEKRSVRCNYCEAQILLPVENETKNDDKFEFQKLNHQIPPPPKNRLSKEGALLLMLFLFVLIGGSILMSFAQLVFVFLLEKQEQTAKKNSVETPATSVSPNPPKTPLPPKLSYRTYVKYTTNIGAEHLELPTIGPEQLPTFDKKELEKTVFAQKRIEVRIKIGQNGGVTGAEALNGHPALRESSVQAAKKCLFAPRKKETSTVLTYIFVLE